MNAGGNGLDQGADADGEVEAPPALPGWSVNRTLASMLGRGTERAAPAGLKGK